MCWETWSRERFFDDVKLLISQRRFYWYFSDHKQRRVLAVIMQARALSLLSTIASFFYSTGWAAARNSETRKKSTNPLDTRNSQRRANWLMKSSLSIKSQLASYRRIFQLSERTMAFHRIYRSFASSTIKIYCESAIPSTIFIVSQNRYWILISRHTKNPLGWERKDY